ncbi:hypothetical protein F4777DRAFT_535825 [Nemania sp. FL0916]|nr:hypothetical protein F4777DRAFT_535825 [Nemania sp. FL0916]
MGNLKERIKATLLRRNSKQLSPAPSKTSLGPEYTSSASTRSQQGFDASDVQSDRRARASRSLSQERAAKRESIPLASINDNNNGNDVTSNNSNNDGNNVTSKNNDNNNDGNGNGNNGNIPSVAEAETENLQSTDYPTTPAIQRGPAPARARVQESASARAPPSQPDPQLLGPPDLTSNATARSGSDLQHLAADSSATSTAAIPAAATAATKTTTTTTAIPAFTPTITPAAGAVTTPTAATGALPSIHEHPIVPSSSPHPDPPSNFVNVGYDEITNSRDSIYHGSALLTPPTASTLGPPLSPSSFPSSLPSSFSRPLGPPRRQSILPAHQSNIVRALLQGQAHDQALDCADPGLVAMASVRKVWVKRPLASPTLITVNEGDLVDDIREQILRKYANSLGRQFDAPDLTLRICMWEQQQSRPMSPEESIAAVLDSTYPNGQTVNDALLIDIPARRTPKASPNPRFYPDDRPHESGTDYFPPYPPYPPSASASAHAHHAAAASLINSQHPLSFPAAMSIVGGNPLPPLPSPGTTRRLAMSSRPNLQRMHTASPVSAVANSHTSQAGIPSGTHKYSRPARSRTHSGASSDQSNHPPAAPPIPTPPPIERTATPPPRVASPRPSVRTKKKRTIEPPTLSSSLLDSAVPPINILIVEDNMINLRLLEAFVKRLKVRWQTAVNGREAVDKWRAGGFHLVLMDIQLPVMNGLEATREIRRIEKANSIGVFSSSASSPPDEVLPEPAEGDKLANTEMFKSPVIIVALTASSLQSDRQEALAAGCNDFLTKPVDFDWLQRKVKEWGCMQALIDFDGWRKWKDFSQKTQANEAAKKAAAAAKVKPTRKNRLSMTAAAS